MPYFTGGDPIGPNQSAVSLEDFPSSFAASMNAAFTSSWAGDASVLIHDDAKLQQANQGERLDKPAAEALLSQSGVSGITIPDDGYTSDALNILIDRKRNDARRADILERAPTGVAPATARFAAELAGGIADPLNIAASFIPVFGEARVASLLARAGESAFARAGARAAIGAVEGAAGAAALEPIVYGAHQQLQDDYSMTDSLTNLAFGGLLGAGLHVAGGAVGDLLRSGPHPSTRFVGLSVEEIQTALNFERARGGMPVEDQARALESFSPATRRALGAPEAVEAPVHAAPEAGEAEVFRPQVAPGRPGPLAAIDVASRISPELHETAVRTAVADFAQGRAVDVDNVVHMDPAAEPRPTVSNKAGDRFFDTRGGTDRFHGTGAPIDALSDDYAMSGDSRNIYGQGFYTTDAADISAGYMKKGGKKSALYRVEHSDAKLFDMEQPLTPEAHEILSKNMGDDLPTENAETGRPLTTMREVYDEYRKESSGLGLTRYDVQEVFDGIRYELEKLGYRGFRHMGGEATGNRAHDVKIFWTPESDVRLHSADIADYRAPEPATLDDVRATAQRQATPERISVADFFAARAEEQRLASAPREAAPAQAAEAAAAEVTTADEALKALTTNLVQGGMEPERAQALLDTLKPFDDAIVDAKNLGDAVRAAALCGLRS